MSKKIEIENVIGVATGMKFHKGGAFTSQLAANDVADIVESLSQLNSKDKKFNDAVSYIASKLLEMNFQLHMGTHISSAEVSFEYHPGNIRNTPE